MSFSHWKVLRDCPATNYVPVAPNSEVALLQTGLPRFRWRTVTVFLAVIVVLGFVAYFNHGVRTIYYGALSAGAAVALTVQHRRERALLGNRLLAMGVVTDWGKPLRSRSRFVNAILSRFSGNIAD